MPQRVRMSVGVEALYYLHGFLHFAVNFGQKSNRRASDPVSCGHCGEDAFQRDRDLAFR
jgi:hypothetical protein